MKRKQMLFRINTIQILEILIPKQEILTAFFSKRNNIVLCTGHEAAFAAFLCCLCKVGALRMEDQLAIIFNVFDKLVYLLMF